MKVFQHVDYFHSNDGIGNDILGISNAFNSLNIPNYIIARKSDLNQNVQLLENPNQLETSYQDIHILHYGGYGYPVFPFLEIPGKKILRYHNSTPVEFFQSFLNKDAYLQMEVNYLKSRFELISIYNFMDQIWCDSRFNAESLDEIVNPKKSRTKNVPIFRKYLNPGQEPKPRKLIFIGRWSPNKKIEDILYLLYFLVKINPDYKLFLVGKRNKYFQIYNDWILDLIKKLDLSRNVQILENPSDSEMFKHLSESEVYVSMSEHEGFGIPILEAMGAGVLVFAYAQSAIKEISFGKCLLFYHKKFEFLAELLNLVLEKSDVKMKILELQSENVNYYNNYNHIGFIEESLQRIK